MNTTDITPGTIVYIDPHLLTPHPNNTQIYGEEDVTNLAQSIAESGWMKPLTINEKNVVIAGHRRRQAGIKLGWDKVPVIIETFASPEAEMERLLRENENRHKTPEQKIKEGITWEPIEELKAKNRQGTRNDLTSGKIFPDVQRVRDIIADRVGLGSGKNFEKGKEVIKYLTTDIACTSERADVIRMKLNEDQSIGGALDLVHKYQARDAALKKMMEEEEAERLRQQELARQRYLEAARKAEHCTLYHCSVAELSCHIQPDSIDAIITDPPYPQEYLPVYSDLAKFAAYALKPGGSLIAMIGQSYVPEIIDMLREHLTYHWTACYYTPGPATTLYQRRLATSWKPLLWFVKGEYTDWTNGDVFISEKRDKEFHTWGQSESGMKDIIERLTKPDQLICDPFVGGGATAIAAMKLERRFVGCDIDETCVLTLEETKAKMVREVQI